jgi:uncharacterized protein YkwD
MRTDLGELIVRITVRRVLNIIASCLCLIALASCAQVGARTGGTSGRTAAAPSSGTSSESWVIGQVNRVRASHGLKALAVHPVLVNKARYWASQMAGGRCGRDANGTPKICHSDLASGITVRWSLLAENVGAASPKTNLSGVERGLEQSPSHLANMLNRSVDYIGVGIAYRGDVVYVAQEFMAVP